MTAGASTRLDEADMAARAAAVLRANDGGGWTKAAPRLYPHQWSWDSAFIAIGLAHLDGRRALQELQTLFAAQWTTGMVPTSSSIRRFRWAPASPTPRVGVATR